MWLKTWQQSIIMMKWWKVALRSLKIERIVCNWKFWSLVCTKFLNYWPADGALVIKMKCGLIKKKTIWENLRKSKGLCTCAPKGNIEEFFKCVQQLSELLARGCEASLPAKSGISKLMHSCKRAIASTCNTNTNPWQYSIPYIEMLK